MLMTAMQSLLEKYDIDPSKIGRLEVRDTKAVEEGKAKTKRHGERRPVVYTRYTVFDYTVCVLRDVP